MIFKVLITFPFILAIYSAEQIFGEEVINDYNTDGADYDDNQYYDNSDADNDEDLLQQ